MTETRDADWESRIQKRVRHLGFADIFAFVSAHPMIPFGQLFRILRDDNTDKRHSIAIAQFQHVYFRDAARQGHLREAILDTLLRRLREHLRQDWNHGRTAKARRASAYSQWELPTFDRQRFVGITERIWQALIDLSPPDDWCPESAKDPFLEEAFASGWPEDRQGDASIE
jgi:hypothetical protein